MAEDVSFGRQWHWRDDQPRPPSVKAAIVNQSRGLTVDVIGCNFVMHKAASLLPNALPVLRLVRVSDVASDLRTTAVPGVTHDTANALADVLCYRLPIVTTGDVLRTMPKATQDYLSLGSSATTGFLTRHQGASVHGARGVGLRPGLELAGGSLSRSIICRAGEGVAVTLPTTGLDDLYLPLGGARVEFVVRDVATGCVTTYLATHCDVSLASASQANPRALASVFVPAGSSEVIEVLSVNVVSEEDEYPILASTQLTMVTLARMPWTAIEDADPSLEDHTSGVVGHAGDDVTQWGVRCVRGDIPLRYADGDFVRTDTGSVTSGDEASLNSSYLHAPLPGQVVRRAVQHGVSRNIGSIFSPLTDPCRWRGPTSRNPISVRSGEAFVATVSPDRLSGAPSSIAGAYLVMDLEITFQVRRPRGAPFGRAA